MKHLRNDAGASFQSSRLTETLLRREKYEHRVLRAVGFFFLLQAIMC